MAKWRRRRPLYVAALIEQSDNTTLIVLPKSDEPERRWTFPMGEVREDEAAEAGMRRIAQEQLGVRVEIVVGQPPLVVELDGRQVELRYFFCGIAGGEVSRGSFAEIRWVSKAHLAEYEFDDVSRPIAEWLMTERA